MKKLILMIPFFFALSASQAQWYHQNIIPNDNNFREVFYMDNLPSTATGWIVGQDNLMLRTNENGVGYWVPLYFDANYSVHGIWFTDPDHGFVIGDNGGISYTGDGGYSWSMVSSGTTNNLRSVYFSSPDRGWIAGDDGTLLHSVDEGLTWTQVPTGTYHDLRAVLFLDNMTGWVAGGYGNIRKTTDGGESWVQQYMTTNASILTSITFSDENNGWVSGEDMVLFTSNGGVDWQTSTGTIGMYYPAVYFRDQNEGWYIADPGSVGVIKHTQDGGANWVEQTSVNYILESLCFTQQGWGMAVGYPDRILIQPPGGTTWTQLELNFLKNHLASVCFVDNLKGWIAGSDGIILKTSDGGNHWYAVHGSTAHQFSDIHFVDDQEGWVTDFGGEILHSTDGGLHWMKLLNVPVTDYYSIFFNDQQHGWAVSWSGYIIRTTDGGSNWLEYAETPGLTSVFFADNNHGWISKDYGMTNPAILYTDDGGESWEEQFTFGSSLKDVFFIDDHNGWCTGQDGYILKTTDSGINWQVYNAGEEYDFTAIKFAGENEGWVTGQNGEILHSVDGGVTWEEQQSNITSWISSLDLSDNQHLWVAGINGVILHSDNGGTLGVNNKPENYNELIQVYPNPVQRTANISFAVDRKTKVSAQVLNAAGMLIEELSNRVYKPGKHVIQWKPANLQPGVYFILLKIDNTGYIRKMVKSD